MFPRETESTLNVDLPEDFDLPIDQETDEPDDDFESSATGETSVEEHKETLESRK
jgi:hypothetical protein